MQCEEHAQLMQRYAKAQQEADDWSHGMNLIADTMRLPSGAVRKHVWSLVHNAAEKQMHDLEVAGRCVKRASEIIDGYLHGRKMDSQAMDWLARFSLHNAGGMARELAAQDSDNTTDING